MDDWYDKAEGELFEAFKNGEISKSEFQREMRQLNAELIEFQREMRELNDELAADEAYNDVMGGWGDT